MPQMMRDVDDEMSEQAAENWIIENCIFVPLDSSAGIKPGLGGNKDSGVAGDIVKVEISDVSISANTINCGSIPTNTGDAGKDGKVTGKERKAQGHGRQVQVATGKRKRDPADVGNRDANAGKKSKTRGMDTIPAQDIAVASKRKNTGLAFPGADVRVGGRRVRAEGSGS
ncbi:hypothetical protein QC761_506735 [Podospora bellae-mahoneyi]|uniref:Uncharacterized protein n=1 Tax=Podospora bellae-mahoneyi TaxID=2093777 RepID=A0ABR0FE62_9PEZI|nr:hypothetical protein QC761_506735 [Podospora bellae-mahoneyi]